MRDGCFEYRRLYDSYKWRKLKRHQLRAHPLCAKCAAKGKVTAAGVVHHTVPHKGDLTLFYLGQLESLCAHCHDGITQQDERNGFSMEIGLDGWPTDPNHPANRKRKNDEDF